MESRKTNQHILNAPQLASDQYWKVEGYLLGSHVRKSPKKFEEFDSLQFISRSGGAYHFIGDGSRVLVCSIQIR